MNEIFASAFLSLLVVIDPLGCAPIYAGLVKNANRSQQRIMAIRAVVVSFFILIGFALFGEALLKALHIDLDSFRIAGGVMLFLIALDMVFERRTQRREERAEKVAADPEIHDVSIFPMAMPMIAGPGAIAAIMLSMSSTENMTQQIAVFSALGAVLLLTGIALVAAVPIMRLLGDNVEAVVTRLLGVLVAAFATQFIVDGIKGSFGV